MENSVNNRFIENTIKPEQVENQEFFRGFSDQLICFVCLNIPLTPLECHDCNSVICNECNEILKIAGKMCYSNKCNGNVKKANKFIREVLSKLSIKCEFCERKRIPYSDYKKHLNQECKKYKLLPDISKRENLLNSVQEKNVEIQEIKENINKVKLSSTMRIIHNRSLSKKLSLSKENVRNSLITYGLSAEGKMELYNSTLKGDIGTFKQLITQEHYPLLEEISAHNYYWTALHYSMHYGREEIIFFILDLLKYTNKLKLALQLESSDGRCPLLCLLRSNKLDIAVKKQLVDKILEKYDIPLNHIVLKDMVNKNFNDILRKYNYSPILTTMD
jgi:hypothetical protein